MENNRFDTLLNKVNALAEEQKNRVDSVNLKIEVIENLLRLVADNGFEIKIGEEKLYPKNQQIFYEKYDFVDGVTHKKLKNANVPTRLFMEAYLEDFMECIVEYLEANDGKSTRKAD